MGKLAQEQVALLTDYDTDSAYSVAYHTLYTNIRFNWDTERFKQHSLLLTTPTSYSEQSTTAANVAIAAAQSGTPTILVDAHLHAPGLHQRFGTGEKPGLSNLLTSEKITDEMITSYLCKTFVADLSLLSQGTATLPTQQIGRLFSVQLEAIVSHLQKFLAATESRPGLIIFNSPAVLASTEASQIAALAEQTFLLIAVGRTTRSQAKQAQEQLERAHATLAGMILLDV